MKNICIVTSESEGIYKQIEILSKIIDQKKYQLFIYFIEGIQEETIFRKVTNPDFLKQKYSLICFINFTKFGVAMHHKCPKFWIDNFDCNTRLIEGISNISHIDRIFCQLNDSTNISVNSIFKDFCITYHYLTNTNFVFMMQNKKNQEIKTILLDLFHLNYFEQLFQIIQIVNQLKKCYVKILSPFNISKLLASHCSQISDMRNVFLEEIDLVITSKSSSLLPILSGIPCIIIGDYGYNGIVSESNLIYLLKSNFSGRLGGYATEAIPQKLLAFEISNTLFYNESCNANTYSKMINEYLFKIGIMFNKIIDNYIRIYEKPEKTDIKFILNPIYKINILDNHYFVVLDIKSEPVYALSNSEYNSIEQYIDSKLSFKMYLQNYTDKKLSLKFSSLITNLLKTKILMPHE